MNNCSFVNTTVVWYDGADAGSAFQAFNTNVTITDSTFDSNKATPLYIEGMDSDGNGTDVYYVSVSLRYTVIASAHPVEVYRAVPLCVTDRPCFTLTTRCYGVTATRLLVPYFRRTRLHGVVCRPDMPPRRFLFSSHDTHEHVTHADEINLFLLQRGRVRGHGNFLDFAGDSCNNAELWRGQGKAPLV